eukprot:m.5492 g.5492  ORF g.5492 m.5492 type:complete len:64 (-) comp3316_c0_seq1:2157-2348(-)
MLVINENYFAMLYQGICDNNKNNMKPQYIYTFVIFIKMDWLIVLAPVSLCNLVITDTNSLRKN